MRRHLLGPPDQNEDCHRCGSGRHENRRQREQYWPTVLTQIQRELESTKCGNSDHHNRKADCGDEEGLITNELLERRWKRIGYGRLDIFFGKARKNTKNLADVRTADCVAHDRLYRDVGPGDDRSSVLYLRIADNPGMRGHWCSLAFAVHPSRCVVEYTNA